MLLERHKLPMSEIARMTPIQIARVAFHPRKQDGSLVPPAPAVGGRVRGDTLESELAFLRSLKGWDAAAKPHCAEAERKLHERYGVEHGR